MINDIRTDPLPLGILRRLPHGYCRRVILRESVERRVRFDADAIIMVLRISSALKERKEYSMLMAEIEGMG